MGKGQARARNSEVHRLTTPAANVKDPGAITFTGQYVDDAQGAVHGRVKTEVLGRDSKLCLKSSEAVLMAFD
ncbi:hypothetical protein BDW62DRAFT_74509 [Aspergillus aurantiobrunneus]